MNLESTSSGVVTMLVAGAPHVASALSSVPATRVLTCDSVDDIAVLAKSGQLPANRSDIVFLVADNLPGQSMPLDTMITRFVSAGWSVVLLGFTGHGRDLVGQLPAARFAEPPFSLNSILSTISSFGIVSFDPVPHGYDPLGVAATSTAPDPAIIENPFSDRVSGPVSQPSAAQPNPFTGQLDAASHPTPVPAPAPSFQSTPTPMPVPTVDTFGAGVSAPPSVQAPVQENPFGGTQGATVSPASPAASQVMPFEGLQDTTQAPTPSQTNPFGGVMPAPPAPVPSQVSPFGEAPSPVPMPSASQINPFGEGVSAPPNPPAPAPSQINPFGEGPATPNAAPAPAPSQMNPFGGGPAPSPVPVNPFGGPTNPFSGTPGTMNPFSGSGAAAPQDAWSSGTGRAGVPATGVGADAFGGVGWPSARVDAAPQQHGMQKNAKVILVAASKGGVGKSGVAVNLAAYLGMRLRGTGKTVAIIDANIQQADTGKLIQEFTPNIANLLRDPVGTSPERIMSHMIHRPNLNLHLLLGPTGAKEANPNWFTPALYLEIVQTLRGLVDYIILDSPVAEYWHELFSEFLLPAADYVLVPVTPDEATVMNVSFWLEAVCAPIHQGGVGLTSDRVGIIINRYAEGLGMTERDIQDNLSKYRVVGIIPETQEWQLARNYKELVATRNYTELNSAFAHILQAATGEHLIDADGTAPAATEAKRGLFGRIRGKR